MANNSLVMLRENFELVRSGNVIEVTATHPRLGRKTVSVAVPHTESASADDYAMQRWVALIK